MTFVSSGAFLTDDLAEIVAQARQTPGIGLELSGNITPPDEAALAEAFATASQAGLPLRVHNYFPPPKDPFVLNLAARDPEEQQRTRQFCERAIELAARGGAPYYSVHAGFAFELKPEMLGRPNAQKEALSTQTVDREASLLAMRDTVRHLADFAKARGMDLLLENNVLAPGPLLPDGTSPLLMVTPEDLPAFFAEADRDNLGLLLDTGHAKVSAHTLGFSLAHFLEAATPHLGAFHLSDNDGTADTNERFDDDAWFAPYLRDHAATETVIEVYRIGPEGIREQKDRLERIRTRA